MKTIEEEIAEYRDTKRKQLLSMLPASRIEGICDTHKVTSKFPNTDFKRNALLINWNDAIKRSVLKALEFVL